MTSITIPTPVVPYPGATTSADFLRIYAERIVRQPSVRALAGSNLTATVVKLLLDAANAMDEANPPLLPCAQHRPTANPACEYCSTTTENVRRATVNPADLCERITAHTGESGDIVVSACARAEEAELFRDMLAQAMWDARGQLGFDNDGDETPAAAIAGGGYRSFATQHVEEARSWRQDYDEALEESRPRTMHEAMRG